MLNDETKLILLEMSGYKYKFEGDLHFNRATKKIFSDNAIQDHDINWLREKIEEENISEIMVYFNNNLDSKELENLKKIFNM